MDPAAAQVLPPTLAEIITLDGFKYFKRRPTTISSVVFRPVDHVKRSQINKVASATVRLLLSLTSPQLKCLMLYVYLLMGQHRLPPA